MVRGVLHIRGIVSRLSLLLRSDDGATTAEYALILTLVVIMLISTLSALGTALNTKLRTIIDQINAAQ